MKVSSKFFVIPLVVTILSNIDLTSARVEAVTDPDYKFLAFIGTRLTQDNEIDWQEPVREVVGIGVVISDKYVLTIQEYLKWYGLPNIEYFVLLGTFDFDVGGNEVEISEKIPVPQNISVGTSFLLLKFKESLTTLGATTVIFEVGLTLIPGNEIEMIGIFQRNTIRFGVIRELLLVNTECRRLLDIDGKDKRYDNDGSHMCFATTKLTHTECRSHVGSITVVHQPDAFPYLFGLKSAVHQTCSTFPIVMPYQRIIQVVKWIKAYIREN